MKKNTNLFLNADFHQFIKFLSDTTDTFYYIDIQHSL